MCEIIAVSLAEMEALGHANVQAGCWFLSLVLQDIIWGELAVHLLFFSRVSRLIRDGAENLCVFPEWHLLRCTRDCINSCSFSTGDKAPHIRLRRSSYKPDREKMLGALT